MVQYSHLGGEGGRLDHDQLMTGLYNHQTRPESSSSASPPSSHPHFPPFPSSSAGILVPQPINASKMSGMGGEVGFSHHMNGGSRKYQCKMCPQGFGSKADLQLHTQVHMREPKPYKCSHCSKSFANSSYLSQHMRIHLGIKPYRCEICQRKFTQLSHLQQHIRTHTGDKPYKCRHQGCTKAFSQLSNLQSHSRCHQVDKPHKCNSCYKCFSDEQSLLEHIPKHKESKHLKTHICSYCGKSYTQETYLAKHMQKHSDRSDKRPPIVASGTTNPGMGALGNIPSPPDHYWPKMDSFGYGAHHLMDQRLTDPRDYDPRVLHPSNQQPGLMPESGHAPGSWSEHAAALSPNSVKTSSTSSSAFSSLQSSMLQSTGSSFTMPNPRPYSAYPVYDPISFPQPPTKVNFGEPSSTTTPTIPLAKIRDFAHHSHNDGRILKSLSSLTQDKAFNQLGQLGAAQ